MTLESKLSQIREASKDRIPAEKRAVMERAQKDLRDGGCMEKIIKVGDKLPSFALKNERGEVIHSDAVLASGPMVLTVFRGHW